MKSRLFASLIFFTTLSLATFAYAQNNTESDLELQDPLADALFEVISIDGTPIGEFPRLTRLRAEKNALVFHDLCVPMAIGRVGYTLGGDFDPSIFGPRPAIECIAEHPVTTKIGPALGRADRIVLGTTPNIFWVLSGDETVMTLQKLN